MQGLIVESKLGILIVGCYVGLQISGLYVGKLFWTYYLVVSGYLAGTFRNLNLGSYMCGALVWES